MLPLKVNIKVSKKNKKITFMKMIDLRKKKKH